MDSQRASQPFFRPAVGTKAWEEAGGPPLSLFQKCGQLAGATLEYVVELPAELGWHMKASRPPPELGLPELPDSPAVRAAEEELLRIAGDCSEVIGHSYRCFCFAELGYRHSGSRLTMDREVLAMAMLLHDIGLVPATRTADAAPEFTVRGAQIARRIAKKCGWSSARQDLVAQTITVNANARVPLNKWGPEAHFGRLAPVMDGLGQVWRLHPNDARQLFEKYPQGRITEVLPELVVDEARHQPGGRFGLYKAFFPLLIRLGAPRWLDLAAGAGK